MDIEPIDPDLIARKILVIEDHPDQLAFVVHVLRKAGYAPIEAVDGLSGIRKFRKDKPDLVVLDIMLPDIDGWEILKKIKRGIKSRKIPVIVLTAKDENIDEMKGYQFGADYYVIKPFDTRNLLSVISCALLKCLKK